MTLPGCGSFGAPPVFPGGGDERQYGRLMESWKSYVGHFIQKDGRVIDLSAGAVTTSEGQAYAMLRAVWSDDRATFDRVNRWALDNLNASVRKDRLWAWKWGKDNDGRWRALDRAFATDADEDAALALILASEVWGGTAYLRQAQGVLEDLWAAAAVTAGGRRFLLAGDSLCKDGICRLNPSYCAPYAYRLFGEVDSKHQWSELADSSYAFLEACSGLTKTRLPPDWVELDIKTGRLRLGSSRDSRFSYDAFRVYWRVDMDWLVHHDRRAENYMKSTLGWIVEQWRLRGRLPAVISARGTPDADYQSLEMVSGLMPAVREIDPRVAAQMNARLQESYSDGSWDGKNGYYLQNWAWFGTALYGKHLPPALASRSAKK